MDSLQGIGEVRVVSHTVGELLDLSERLQRAAEHSKGVAAWAVAAAPTGGDVIAPMDDVIGSPFDDNQIIGGIHGQEV